MALIKIKQINNTPASTGDVITFDGTQNVWAPVPNFGLVIVTTFAGLPGSPTTNDLVFYTLFNSVMAFDGTDWVGPKMTESMFGRAGSSPGSTYLRGIARFQTGDFSGVAHGAIVPDVAGGSSYKVYGMAAANVNDITGTMELHADSTVPNPVFGTTGVGSTLAIVAQNSNDITFGTPEIVANGSKLQCFYRVTTGGWREWNVNVTYSLVATA